MMHGNVDLSEIVLLIDVALIATFTTSWPALFTMALHVLHEDYLLTKEMSQRARAYSISIATFKEVTARGRAEDSVPRQQTQTCYKV